MFFLRHPSEQVLEQLRANLRNTPLSYGRTEWVAPQGFWFDEFACVLGRGQAVFEAAKVAVRDWKMFPKQMVEVWPQRAPIETDTIGAILFRAGPLWTANFCRIVDVIDDEHEQRRRFGFVYCTLPHHVEQGQEQFLVEWDRTTDEVRYSIRAVSRPAHWLIWLGYPYARWQQSRFRKLSGRAMQAAVQP